MNVPEWFVREGSGELCLSVSPNGMSVIRYWPKFLSEKGIDLMMTKWHQKQVKVGGEWKYQFHRLISMIRHQLKSCFLNLYRQG